MPEFNDGIIPNIEYAESKGPWPEGIARAMGTQFAAIAKNALRMGKERIRFHLDGQDFIDNCFWAQAQISNEAGKLRFDNFIAECRYVIKFSGSYGAMIAFRYTLAEAERFAGTVENPSVFRLEGFELIPC